jgi:Fe-S-cluster containining protein
MVEQGSRNPLPLFPNVASECATCVGACCRRGILVPFTDTEATFMQEHRADLWDPGLIGARSAGDGTPRTDYALQSDCPFLVQAAGGAALCGIYEDPRRPEACATFEAGGATCHRMREQPYRLPLSAVDFMM